MRFAGALLLGGLVIACSDDGGKTDAPAGDPPVFPADYAATYQEVRNCRLSIEHNMVRVRVLASPDALQPYTTRAAPFPVGAVVLKEEYDVSNASCATPVFQYTVMQKLAPGSSPATLDWTWQTVDSKRHTVVEDVARCPACHKTCGVPPDGYDATCTVP